ncbi:hypothetical protein EW145_g1183 [Phellinidium pouzarii]|uniref:DNA polymerase kappa n=1 Tax=Phellinidium pouzarii TaxID=167371 RepID=A0A4V6S1B0_9AGAM|nr:hypothetical protein EW145_g1183 [Phellinidium pouzarii]
MNDEGDDEAVAVALSQDPGFLRRLAGSSNSVNKAGLAIDQTEINRRIAEASRGSKFYDNEKRRDADWTERINKILARRDDLLSEADIGRVEAKVDRIFADLEANRDLSQIIVHVDMDAFFANVELQHNSDLKDKPFAVVGLGIVTTASYDARKFGVRSAMPEFVAKKLCPEILLVPVDYKKVGVVSSKVMAVCKEYDPNMYIAGCDEGYLNVTNFMKEHELDAAACVEQLRAMIFERTNLTASAGIASNMMLAKICSDKNKPNGQFQLPFERDAIMNFMRDLPVRKIPGIGRVGERVLEAIGVKTCGDIWAARAIIWLMPKKFSVNFLFEVHLGISPAEVKPPQRDERKSVGASRTFRPVHTRQAIFEKLEYIASLLERDLEMEGWVGKVVILTYKLDTFRVFTRRATFERWISKKEDLFNIGKELIKPYLPLRIRLLGLRVTDLKDLHAPTDQGIKRYFESEGGDSPSKKRKKTHLSGRPNELPDSPSKRPAGEDMVFVEPIVVDEEEIEVEDELVGETAEDEDELDEDEDTTVEEEQKQKLVMQEVPIFRYRNVATSATSAIKAGNDRPINKPTKPNSAIAQNRIILPLPIRSKSEQPLSASKNKQSEPSRLPTSSKPASSKSTSGYREISETPMASTKEHEVLTCPICSRELETDNSGLNAHVDYCLSRGAIMEAASTTRFDKNNKR